MRSPTILLWSVVLLLGGVIADTLEEGLSFGHKDTISQRVGEVSGWRLEGDPQVPSILSDRILLTPPWPGNRRGALWTDQRMPKSEWTSEFEFRATGPERGGGNLQLWYTKDAHGTSSIYTVGKFDGLVLEVDAYGGKGGSIRGFLNDGNTEYKTHHNVDSLAFGHCNYAYRNLGRLTKLQIKHTDAWFEVTVDDKPCFKTDHIKLPSNYLFGVSAASAETPDSFEVYKFLVRSSGTSNPTHEQTAHAGSNQQQPVDNNLVTSCTAKLDEVQKRLEALSQRMDIIHSLTQESISKANEQQQQTSKLSNTFEQQLNTLTTRLSSIDSSMRDLVQQKNVDGQDIKQHLTQLQNAFKDGHSSLMTHLPQSMDQILAAATPKSSVLLWLLVVVQLVSGVGYVFYKYRRANSPKKYL